MSEAMREVKSYWPPEDDGVVMPAEITADLKRRELPPCRAGWHVPDPDKGDQCQLCARPLTTADLPYRLEVPPGAVENLLRVLGEGAKAIGKGFRSDTTIDDLSIAASAMAALIREQKTRRAS
jgi:hypothetical protein